MLSTDGAGNLSWNAVSPLTTKGDIFVRNSTTSARLPVGPDGYSVVADSSQPTGLSWQSIGAGSDNTTPYYIPIGGTWINNLYNQSLFAVSIDVQGILEVDGILCEVD